MAELKLLRYDDEIFFMYIYIVKFMVDMYFEIIYLGLPVMLKDSSSCWFTICYDLELD